MSEPSFDRTHAAIRESFEQILKQNFAAAQRALAVAQHEHYGQRPWTPDAPAVDAIGNGIVFDDRDGQGRYGVEVLEEDDSHVRIPCGGAGSNCYTTRFKARGRTQAQAQWAAERLVEARGLKNVKLESSYELPNRWTELVFTCGEAPLD